MVGFHTCAQPPASPANSTSWRLPVVAESPYTHSFVGVAGASAATASAGVEPFRYNAAVFQPMVVSSPDSSLDPTGRIRSYKEGQRSGTKSDAPIVQQRRLSGPIGLARW